MNDLTITTIDNEPRLLDTDIAERLGMERPRDIRANLIKPNLAELEGFGALRSENAKPTGGRPSNVYYLNEEQALLLCMLSRTEKAREVRAQVIKVFMAWRRGQLQQAETGAALEHRIVAIIDAAIEKRVPELIEQSLARDPRIRAVDYLTAKRVAIDQGVPQKGRKPLIQKISNNINSWCKKKGYLVKEDTEERRIFPREAVVTWLKDGGGAGMIAKFRAEKKGQGVLHLVETQPQP